MYLQSLISPAIATGIALVSASVAIWLLRGEFRLARYLVPLSGALLMAVALVGLLPEVAEALGWLRTLILAGLEGYSGMPLVAAVAVHSFVDGWGLVTVNMAGPRFIAPVAIAILLHKIPEGLALGGILRSRQGSAQLAFLLSAMAELPTFFGGAIGLLFAPGAWLPYPLGIAAGAFLFLGGHALRTSSKSLYHGSAS